jgi:phage shock protein A
MWQRMRRVMRSFAGWFVSLGEDPELILKQNIRDLQDQEPKLNENLAQVAGQKNLAERELKKLSDQENDLTAKIKAALTQNRRDIARNFAVDLEKVKNDKAAQERQVKQMQDVYEKAMKMKKAFLAEKERKIQEAQAALGAKRRSEYAEQVADAMKTFQVAGIDATHDEMIRKIEEQSAVAEAKLEMAMDSSKADRMEIETKAKEMQADETLRQFELELGLVGDPNAAPQNASKEKTMGPAKERERA